MWKKIIILFGIILAVIEVCNTVTITKLAVPATFIIENSTAIATDEKKYLMLDCEYDISNNEQGFVLKWLLNTKPIYQWIPSRQPASLSTFKNRVNTTYKTSNEKLHMHRTLVVTRPLWNMTGNYTCSVHTFQSNDQKTAFLQIIVPETEFRLQYRTDYDGIVTITCNAFDISPEPSLVISLDTEATLNLSTKSYQEKNGLFQTSVSVRLPQEDIKPESTINCMLSIPGTNYTKKSETMYYAQAPMSTESDVEDVSSGIFSLGIESQPNAGGSIIVNYTKFIVAFVILAFVNLIKIS